MHSWNVTPGQARAIQRELADKIQCSGKPDIIRSIAGVDLAYDKQRMLGFCVIAVLSFPELKVMETCSVNGRVNFPYIPGLLTFREGPLIVKAFSRLRERPDILIFDGQGIAHPRHIGIAAHLGLYLGVPSIGCAKSRLCGSYREPGTGRGDRSLLFDNSNETIGVVLRTREKIKPVFVSPGNLIGIDESADLILSCAIRYRLPEPVRIADNEVRRYKNQTLGR